MMLLAYLAGLLTLPAIYAVLRLSGIIEVETKVSRK